MASFAPPPGSFAAMAARGKAKKKKRTKTRRFEEEKKPMPKWSKPSTAAAVSSLLCRIFEEADADGGGDLSTSEIMLMLGRRAKGTKLAGNMKEMLALRSSLTAHSKMDGGNINKEDFVAGMQSVLGEEPNGSAAKWMSKELRALSPFVMPTTTTTVMRAGPAADAFAAALQSLGDEDLVKEDFSSPRKASVEPEIISIGYGNASAVTTVGVTVDRRSQEIARSGVAINVETMKPRVLAHVVVQADAAALPESGKQQPTERGEEVVAVVAAAAAAAAEEVASLQKQLVASRREVQAFKRALQRTASSGAIARQQDAATFAMKLEETKSRLESELARCVEAKHRELVAESVRSCVEALCAEVELRSQRGISDYSMLRYCRFAGRALPSAQSPRAPRGPPPKARASRGPPPRGRPLRGPPPRGKPRGEEATGEAALAAVVEAAEKAAEEEEAARDAPKSDIAASTGKDPVTGEAVVPVKPSHPPLKEEEKEERKEGGMKGREEGAAVVQGGTERGRGGDEAPAGNSVAKTRVEEEEEAAEEVEAELPVAEKETEEVAEEVSDQPSDDATAASGSAEQGAGIGVPVAVVVDTAVAEARTTKEAAEVAAEAADAAAIIAADAPTSTTKKSDISAAVVVETEPDLASSATTEIDDEADAAAIIADDTPIPTVEIKPDLASSAIAEINDDDSVLGGNAPTSAVATTDTTTTTAAATAATAATATATAAAPARTLDRHMTATMGGNWPKPERMSDVAMQSLQKLAVTVFNRLDSGGKNSLVESDIVSNGEVDEFEFILAAFGQDMKKSITMDEFTQYILATAREEGIDEVEAGLTQMLTHLSRTMSVAAKKFRATMQLVQPDSSKATLEQLRELAKTVFNMIDTDCGGTICPDEASAAFGDDDDMWQYIVEEADTDGDGEIDVDEWCVYIMEMANTDGNDEAYDALHTMMEEIEQNIAERERARSEREMAEIGEDEEGSEEEEGSDEEVEVVLDHHNDLFATSEGNKEDVLKEVGAPTAEKSIDAAADAAYTDGVIAVSSPGDCVSAAAAAAAPSKRHTLLGGVKPRKANRGTMLGAAHHSSIQGPLLKRSRHLQFQRRWFHTQTHYLAYKVNVDDEAFAGGVDLRGPESTIEMMKKDTVLKVIGLDADVSDPSKPREVRTFILKATTDAAPDSPSLQQWFDELTASQKKMRTRHSLHPEASPDDGSDAPSIAAVADAYVKPRVEKETVVGGAQEEPVSGEEGDEKEEEEEEEGEAAEEEAAEPEVPRVEPEPLTQQIARSGAKALAIATAQSTKFVPPPTDAANDYVKSRIPDRYCSPLFHGGEGVDAERAQARWEETLAWRKEAGIDALLYTPQPGHDLMQLAYPSFFHGRDKDGDRVWYEQLGRVDIGALQAKGIGPDEVLLHKLFVAEYLWRVVEPNPEAQCTTVLDVGGLKLNAFKGQGKSKFVKKYAQLMTMHYPQRTKRIVIVNTPFFFPALWKVAKKFLDAETRAKVVIMKDQKKKKKRGGGAKGRALEAYIDVEELPKCCAYTCVHFVGV